MGKHVPSQEGEHGASNSAFAQAPRAAGPRAVVGIATVRISCWCAEARSFQKVCGEHGLAGHAGLCVSTHGGSKCVVVIPEGS